MWPSDMEEEKTEVPNKYRYSSLNQLATSQVSGNRLEQVQSNMAGIQNSILNTNTANTVQLRRQLEEKNKTIKKLKEDLIMN